MTFLKRIPDLSLAMTLLVMWCVVVGLVVVTYLLVRWWKRRHPGSEQQNQHPYARQLRRRLAEHRHGKADPKSAPRNTTLQRRADRSRRVKKEHR